MRKSRQKGQNLVELMMAAAATLIAGGVVGLEVLENARRVSLGWNMNEYRKAVNRLTIDTGVPVAQNQATNYGNDPGLLDINNATNQHGWSGSYLQSLPTTNPWGNEGPNSGKSVYSLESELSMEQHGKNLPGGFIDHNGSRSKAIYDSLYVLFDGADGRVPNGVGRSLDEQFDDGNPTTGHMRREKTLYGGPDADDDLNNVIYWYIREGNP